MAVSSGYKQTEIGSIPDDWDVVSIRHIATIKTGPFGTLLKAAEYSQSGVPVVSVGEIRQGFLRISDSTPRVSETVTNRLPQYVLRTGDIVFGRKGGVDRSAPIAQEHDGWFLGSDGIVIRAQAKHDYKYLTFQFLTQRVRNWLLANSTGTTMPSLSQGVLGGVQIAVPSLMVEQRAIAGALSDADALIESLEQLLTKKRQIKQGAMQQLLTGKKRLPGFTGKWKIKRLGLLATIQRGASPRPIENPVWFDDNSSVGWVRISDVTSSGMYLTATTQRLSPLGIQNSRPVSRGSLIMSICATVGRPTITDIDVCIHDGFVVFENLKIDKSLLYYVLRSIETSWSQRGQTGSQMNLNTGLIVRTEVLLPSNTDEQAAIAAVLHDVDAEIATIEIKITKTRQLKQGIMQELLTGRIRLG